MDGNPIAFDTIEKPQINTLETLAPSGDVLGVRHEDIEIAAGNRAVGKCSRRVYITEHSAEDVYVRRSRFYARVKRGFDIAACILAAPLVLPIIFLCALAVRLSSPGPILFRQKRAGQGGRTIEMLKFRSMVADAEEQKASLKASKGMTGPDFKLEKDPRITWIGALMRKTSLDELPQLWNVFRGDMSLVGPRPTSFGVDTYQAWHAERLEVKPGLTGLWQIKARGDLDFDYRVRLDITYVRQQSFMLDLWILVWTIPCVVAQKGAY
jgi:lipopolysaccharide/colanic/teichoic acid biosynthesis glycosyltransferase